jgi:N-acetylmuramoyl-L-alanine amidase
MNYIVKRGDCLTTIASRFGFADHRAIYDHPENAAFRELRRDPNVIHQGDHLFIPDREAKRVACAIGREHRFQVNRAKKTVHVALLDPDGQPIVDMPYELVVGDRKIVGRTRADGAIDERVPIDVLEAKLTVQGLSRVLKIGDLNPLRGAHDDGLSGVKGRLTNLGFHTGGLEPALDDDTRDAICAFQRASGLEETGAIDPALLAALEQKYPY